MWKTFWRWAAVRIANARILPPVRRQLRAEGRRTAGLAEAISDARRWNLFWLPSYPGERRVTVRTGPMLAVVSY